MSFYVFCLASPSHVPAFHSGNTNDSSASADAMESVSKKHFIHTRTMKTISRVPQTELSTKSVGLFPCCTICLRRSDQFSPSSDSITPR